MRLMLPPRVLESSPIFRDILGLGGIYEVKSGASAPEALRVEGGVLLVHDLQASMATQLSEIDAVEITAAPAGASTTATVNFSFPTLPSGGPAAHHRILSALIFVNATPANFEAADVRSQPFGDPTTARLAHVVAANLVTSTLMSSIALPNLWGLWGKREQDYTFNVRSTAGGATSAKLSLLVEMVPAGVAVPR